MAEMTPPAKIIPRKKGGWFQRIPRDIIFTPAGAVLIAFALGMEVIDWIPVLGLDSLTWELAIEIIFIVFLVVLVKDISKKSLVLPLIVERIPVLSDVIPSWLLKFFV